MLDSTPVTKSQSASGEGPLTRDQALTRLALSDYVMLTKPRIISLLLVITLLPMFLAGEQAPSGWLILWTMIGGFLAAGGANAVNQYVDRDIDNVMVRTRKRPLPGGRMTRQRVPGPRSSCGGHTMSLATRGALPHYAAMHNQLFYASWTSES